MEKKPSILSSSMGAIAIAIIFDGSHFIKYPFANCGSCTFGYGDTRATTDHQSC